MPEIVEGLDLSVAVMVFLVPALYLVIHSPAREQECFCTRGMENVEK